MAQCPPLGVLFGLAFVAGCLAPSTPDALSTLPESREVSLDRMAGPSFDFTKAIQKWHDDVGGHENPDTHNHGFGMTVVSRTPLVGAVGTTGTAPIAMDTWKTYACVSFRSGLGGAVIVDIADPAKPKVLSSVTVGSTSLDCQFTDDGELLVVSGGSGRSVHVYDVRDKAKPKLTIEDEERNANAYHTLFTAQINGTHYIFQPYAGNILALLSNGTKLEKVSTVEIADHDMWVGPHPITGGWVMITGDNAGTRIYDMNDPAHPKLMGAWAGKGNQTGWHRQWPITKPVQGRALMVVAGESGSGHSLSYTVLDFTEPFELERVGRWQVPGDPRADAELLPRTGIENPLFDQGGYLFSPHELETWDGYVVAGNYHAGVWLFDVGSLERSKNPVTLGYYLPHGKAQDETAANVRRPDVWGAYFDDRGYILTADVATGLHILSFEKTHTM